ncbi:hypothetical protein AMATHDRAFT_51523 [Amanita thiersii Skay4041]|uniref:Uncharacterized protein n=1 Tax=Amanita thiersii Skay4041 TaxID=703135 RepID=A0A2A9N916_9AGAR|nr:hypothetical protein AMATHDRAFT_51523 [Amanita thiersii Skay4041]
MSPERTKIVSNLRNALVRSPLLERMSKAKKLAISIPTKRLSKSRIQGVFAAETMTESDFEEVITTRRKLREHIWAFPLSEFFRIIFPPKLARAGSGYTGDNVRDTFELEEFTQAVDTAFPNFWHCCSDDLGKRYRSGHRSGHYHWIVKLFGAAMTHGGKELLQRNFFGSLHLNQGSESRFGKHTIDHMHNTMTIKYEITFVRNRDQS